MRRVKKYIACALSAAMIMSSVFTQRTVILHAEEQEVGIESASEESEDLSDVDEAFDVNNSTDDNDENDEGDDNDDGNDYEESEFDYAFNEDEVSIVIIGYNGSATELIIPDEICGLKVTSIRSDAFRNSDSITKVTIPEGVESIGNEAFAYCYNLTDITIPDSVVSIARSAFLGWSDDFKITCSKNSYAYEYAASCNIAFNLTDEDYDSSDDFVIADNIKYWINRNSEEATVVGYTEDENEDETEVVIPDHVEEYRVTKIGIGAFYGNTEITSVKIPDGVTSIGEEAFLDCYSLKKIELPDSITGIGEEAFANTGLTSVTLPDKLTSIEARLFSGCADLRGVNFSDNITSIGVAAFESSKLASINLPKNLVSISGDAFSNCNELSEVIFPDGLVSIGNYAFFNCAITSIDFPDSLTEIGEKAFSNCKLTSIELPSSLVSIGEEAFSNCENVTKLDIPNGVASIDSHAFLNCGKLSKITIPKSLNNIGYGVFSGCEIESIVVDEANPVYDSRENCNAIIEKASDKLVVGCKNTKITDTVTNIGDYAFEGCVGLTGITITKNIYYIGIAAFAECSELDSISVDSENTIYDSRDNCNAIIEKETKTLVTGCKSTVIPDGVVSIGNAAFLGCSGLNSIKIPDGVKDIGASAFYDCNDLNEITIPDSVNSIGSCAFYQCKNLSKVTILNDEVDISDGVFQYCDNVRILCNSDSTAYAYATDNGIPYQIIGEEYTGPVTKITLSETSLELNRGSKVKLIATVSPEDAPDKTLIWESDDESLATVDDDGNVTVLDLFGGTVTITCRAADGSGVYASCDIKVDDTFRYVESIKLSKSSITLAKGGTAAIGINILPVDASSPVCTWESVNPKVATVNENGKVTAVSAGTTTIICSSTDGSGKTASCKVTVTQPVKGVTLNLKSKTLTNGKSVTLKAKINPSNATNTAVTWKSSNTKVAKVDKNGKVTAVGKGTAKITCTTSDGKKTATCSITVKQPVTKIKLNKTKATIKNGKTLTLKATAIPTNANNKKVKWKSSNTKVATVSSSGKVTARKKGTATITCTAADGSGKKVTCKITVK